jgi:hypothetical protein
VIIFFFSFFLAFTSFAASTSAIDVGRLDDLVCQTSERCCSAGINKLWVTTVMMTTVAKPSIKV